MNKKIKFSSVVIAFFLFINISNGSTHRICESKVFFIDGYDYISGIHCSENLENYSVSINYPTINERFSSTIQNFLFYNEDKVIDYIKEGKNCGEINEVKFFNDFANDIYAKFKLDFADNLNTRLSNIKTREDKIEELVEDYNDEELYVESFNKIKKLFPYLALDILKEKVSIEYYESQNLIKDEIIKLKEETLLDNYSMKVAQNNLDLFYGKLDNICLKNSKIYSEEEKEEEVIEEKTNDLQTEREKLIDKYKVKFKEKIGNKLDKLNLPKISEYIRKKVNEYKINIKEESEEKDLIIAQLTALMEIINEKIESDSSSVD